MKTYIRINKQCIYALSSKEKREQEELRKKLY